MNAGGSSTTGGTALTVAQLPTVTGSFGAVVPNNHALYCSGVFESIILTSSAGTDGRDQNLLPTTSTVWGYDFSFGGNAAHTHSTPAHTHTGTVGGSSVSTLQPYITCYMWKRVS